MSNETVKGRKALGRGLGALIPGAGSGPGTPTTRDYFTCPIEKIHSQPNQPRQRIAEEALKGLADSIREQGLIQPLIVRKRDFGDGFELIAGERRWRAAQLAGLKEVKVCVKETTPAEAFEMALVENLQREDLNPVEEADAFKRLMDEFGYTQAQVALRVGRDRSTISNSLRLLGLPPEVRSMLIEGALTEGHARAILQASDHTKMTALARMAVMRKLSVRETERRARSQSEKNKSAAARAAQAQSPETELLIKRLRLALGARVNLADRKGKGRIEISYTSYHELDRILSMILR